jgi:hypothetical protein
LKLSNFLSDVGRQIAFYPSLVKALGNRNDSIFICQMAYWKDKGNEPDGWIYKTAEEVESETSLTYKEQIRVRKRLKLARILQEKYYKSIHRMYFKVDWDVLNGIWDMFISCEVPDHWSYTTCPLVSSLIGITYNTHIIKQSKNKKIKPEEKEMCDKCKMAKTKIAIDKEYGFEYDLKASEKWLANLELQHKFEEENPQLSKETVEERVLQMLSGHDEYAEKVSEYPETVQKSVMLFAKTFRLSFSAIPKKSKSKGGAFATWIKGIQDLQSIAGNERRFKLVLDKVFNVWDTSSSEFKTHIDMPQKIRGMFVTMESELRGEEEAKKQEIAENVKTAKAEKEVYITDNEETRKQAVAELKKQMRSKKNE